MQVVLESTFHGVRVIKGDYRAEVQSGKLGRGMYQAIQLCIREYLAPAYSKGLEMLSSQKQQELVLARGNLELALALMVRNLKGSLSMGNRVVIGIERFTGAAISKLLSELRETCGLKTYYQGRGKGSLVANDKATGKGKVKTSTKVGKGSLVANDKATGKGKLKTSAKAAANTEVASDRSCRQASHDVSDDKTVSRKRMASRPCRVSEVSKKRLKVV